jgi:putative peptidoglycan lipid II flippase
VSEDYEGSANQQIARAAGVVMVGFVLSNVVGLVRQMLISDAFGTEASIDAFYAASKLPDILFSLVAGGALASAFIPKFTDFLEKKDRSGAWFLASAILNLVVLVLVIVSVLAVVFADEVVSIFLAPDFSFAQQTLTVSILRVLLLSPAIFGVSGLIMGILNSHQSFLLPALAPTMYWLGMIFGVVVLAPTMGIHGLAWGAVIGACTHLFVQIPGLMRLKGKYTPSLGIRFPAVREVGLLMAPRLFGVAVVQLNVLINTRVASGLPEGSLSAIQYGFQIMTMPQVVIAQAISIAALPTFSAQVARGELGQMRSSLASSLRSILFLSLPAALGLILLRHPIVSVLFERGVFDQRSTELVTSAVFWYTVGLVSHSIVEITSRAFYALHDTRTPVIVGAAAMGLNIIFSLTFPRFFTQLGWMPLGGLAFANSVATTLEMIVLLIFMYKRLSGLEISYLIRGTIKAIIATLTMSSLLVLWMMGTMEYGVLLVTLLGILIGGLVYVLMLLLLRVPEVTNFAAVAARLLKKFLSDGR